MRIALVVARFPVASEPFIVDKALALLDRDLDVHVAADAVDEPALRRLLAGRGAALSGRVHRAPVGGGSRAAIARSTVRSPLTAARHWPGLPRGRRLRRLAHDLPLLELLPDVVHTEFVTLAIGRTHLPELLDRPLTTSVRGFDVAHAGLDRPGYLDDVWPALTAVHVLGEDLRARAAERGCPPDLPTSVIPPAVDVADLPAAGPAEPVTRDRPLRLLSIGRLHWKKAHHHTMAALRIVLDDGVPARLTIVGDGDEFEALVYARHQLGLEPEVELVGALPREAARARLAGADLFVHSAVTEGWSNAVLEAQGAGVPVVCSDAEGLSENVDDGRTGLVVPRRDPRAMATAIAELARDPERRDRMGTAGRDRAASFDLRRQTDGFVRFFESAVELGPARPGGRR